MILRTLEWTFGSSSSRYRYLTFPLCPVFRVRCAGRAELRARGRGVQVRVARARQLREHAAPLRGPHQHRPIPGQPLVESGHVTSVLTSDWPGSHPPARGQGAG